MYDPMFMTTHVGSYVYDNSCMILC